ncbi:MAG: hypothetical protein ABI551_21815 [Polyangiaceae bacterium]
MKLGHIRQRTAASLVTIAAATMLPLLGCGEASPESTASNVDELTSNGFTDEDFDGADLDRLGPDPYAMISDESVDALDELPEEWDDAQTEQLMDEPDPMDLSATDTEIAKAHATEPTSKSGGVTAPPPIRCKKRIHATFAIYTYLATNMTNNGCWTAERTTQDDDFRECHSDGDITRPNGDEFFYDDTNPFNTLSTERLRVQRCAKGEKRGFEYLAFRDSRWRIIRAPHVAAYFAELYTSDKTIDDLYYDRGIFRGNDALHEHKRVAPMLNVAPYPPKYSAREIEKEILKVCGHVKNHGYIGLYEWHFPLTEGSKYMTAIERALNRCTRK